MKKVTYDTIQIARFIERAHQVVGIINGDILPLLARHEQALADNDAGELAQTVQFAADALTHWLETHAIEIRTRGAK